MHGSAVANRTLLEGVRMGAGAIQGVEVVVCVPYPYLAQAQQLLNGGPVAWGAQNVSEHDAGAFTGEVSAAMLKDFGCRYVIIGHSERRALYGESDAQVASKFVAASNAGLTPILCVGEQLTERESGATMQVVTRQLDAVLERVGAAALANGVLAYEPVWAIGTGKTATPMQAQEVHAALRAHVGRSDAKAAAELTILYGGSVKGSNAGELFAMGDIDGGLIGGASLKADEFLAICQAGRR